LEQSATPVRLTGLHVARLERWMCGCGAVAQLGERLVRNEEVSGSIPLSSTKESIPSGIGVSVPDARRTDFVIFTMW
jgi:hypothetical protein